MTRNLDPRLAEAPSPLSRTLGFKLTDWTEGFARVEAPLADHLMNRQGLPHGGVYAAMLDTAMGFAGCYTGDAKVRQNALTLSMTVNYLSRATGKHLIAEAHVTGVENPRFSHAERCKMTRAR
ncbi:PaaI family thioesterase [Roseovarius rhodophyticola]|uniref:PaaI family thioesterase n=1 Tax=Roseovarius rhodophyticola TaxID=3080827 RepID=A0ABZ2THF7_9RHOB|nr:PaaI family thioesterase [Roseovarius sp. W115]MDV2929471.1 PaaI family thioesterase [Roseovarius sp. W115]